MSCLSISEDEIVVVGGKNLKSVEIFDPAAGPAGSWRPGEFLPTRREKTRTNNADGLNSVLFFRDRFPGFNL